jgi:hypothetical protein
MRKIIENQLKIGQVDIAKIELDLRSRVAGHLQRPADSPARIRDFRTDRTG